MLIAYFSRGRRHPTRPSAGSTRRLVQRPGPYKQHSHWLIPVSRAEFLTHLILVHYAPFMADHTGDYHRWEDVLSGRLILRRGETPIPDSNGSERLNAVGYDLSHPNIFCTQTEFSVMDFRKIIKSSGLVKSMDPPRWRLMSPANTWEQVKGTNRRVGKPMRCGLDLQKKLEAWDTDWRQRRIRPSTKRRLVAFQERVNLPPTGTPTL